MTALQDDDVLLQMTVSYHRDELGPAHQIPMDDIGLPEGRHQLNIRWVPPVWPRVGSVLGWLLLIGWGLASRRRSKTGV